MVKQTRFYTLALLPAVALLLTFGFTGESFATEENATQFTIGGDMDLWLKAIDGAAFSTTSDKDDFYAQQRLRIWASAIVSDEFSIHTLMRIKPDRWGDGTTINSGYNMDGDGNIFLVRMLYANWAPLEKTRVHAGIIPIALPMGTDRNGILDTSIGGVGVNYELGSGKNVYVAWGRAYDDPENTTGRSSDDTDLFMLKMPLKFDEPNIYFAPWGIYAKIGKDSKYWAKRVPWLTHRNAADQFTYDNGQGAWGGFAARYTIGKLTLSGDFAYGQIKTAEAPMSSGELQYNTAGYFGALKAEYKTSFGTPSLWGWYGSGSDADDVRDKQKWGVLPSISSFGDGFEPSKFGFDSMLVSFVPSGKWGVTAALDQVNFMEKLTHKFSVAFYAGTNDSALAKEGDLASGVPNNVKWHLANSTRDFVLMVKGDRFIEFCVENTYAFSKHLDIKFHVAYINTHRAKEWGEQRDIDDIYGAILNLTYNF